MFLFATGVWLGVALATLGAKPRRPLGIDSDIWLVYSRALGGWERLRICLVIASLCFVLSLVWALGARTASPVLQQRRDPCQSWSSFDGYWTPSPPMDDGRMAILWCR